MTLLLVLGMAVTAGIRLLHARMPIAIISYLAVVSKAQKAHNRLSYCNYPVDKLGNYVYLLSLSWCAISSAVMEVTILAERLFGFGTLLERLSSPRLVSMTVIAIQLTPKTKTR